MLFLSSRWGNSVIHHENTDLPAIARLGWTQARRAGHTEKHIINAIFNLFKKKICGLRVRRGEIVNVSRETIGTGFKNPSFTR
jgi:hypothetical protein